MLTSAIILGGGLALTSPLFSQHCPIAPSTSALFRLENRGFLPYLMEIVHCVVTLSLLPFVHISLFTLGVIVDTSLSTSITRALPKYLNKSPGILLYLIFLVCDCFLSSQKTLLYHILAIPNNWRPYCSAPRQKTVYFNLNL